MCINGYRHDDIQLLCSEYKVYYIGEAVSDLIANYSIEAGGSLASSLRRGGILFLPLLLGSKVALPSPLTIAPPLLTLRSEVSPWFKRGSIKSAMWSTDLSWFSLGVRSYLMGLNTGLPLKGSISVRISSVTEEDIELSAGLRPCLGIVPGNWHMESKIGATPGAALIVQQNSALVSSFVTKVNCCRFTSWGKQDSRLHSSAISMHRCTLDH